MVRKLKIRNMVVAGVSLWRVSAFVFGFSILVAGVMAGVSLCFWRVSAFVFGFSILVAGVILCFWQVENQKQKGQGFTSPATSR